jgi:hypothetical protein
MTGDKYSHLSLVLEINSFTELSLVVHLCYWTGFFIFNDNQHYLMNQQNGF